MRLLTVKQTAELLTISTRKVYALVAAGTLPHYRMDSAVRIDAADAEAYLAGCRVAQQPAALPQDRDSPATNRPRAVQENIKTSHLKIGPRQLALLRRGGVGSSGPDGRNAG